jgi:signal transduction histidine kinase
MVDLLHTFFETNRIVFFFLYGQVFFIVGLAIASQSRRHSRLALTTSLPFLAIFGISNGLAQWGHVFIPIQATYLPTSWIAALQFAQVSLLALSFAALMRFGLQLMTPEPVPQAWASWLPVGLLMVWEVTLVAGWLLHLAPDAVLLTYWEVIGRYLLAGPAAIIAALGLRGYNQREIKPLNLPRIEHFLRLASLSLAALALLNGLIVPDAPFMPANVLNYSLLERTIGVPIQVFLSIFGLILAYSVIRAMEIFQIETAQALEEAERARVLVADRERIGRELHDGTIQSIYAAGLMIESAAYLIEESPEEAQEKLSRVMKSLNNTIQEIRRYIFDLRAEPEPQLADLAGSLSKMLRDLHVNTLLSVDLTVDGEDPQSLTAEQRRHVLSIVREALTNISRHAQAKRVLVRLQWGLDSLRLRIADDGIGMTDLPKDGRGQGLRNMRERTMLLGGKLTISGQPGRGVVVDLEVPYEYESAKRGVVPIL